MLTLRRSTLLALCVCAALAPGASAVTLTEFDVPTAGAQPRNIILGPDGNLYFAEEAKDKIGRVVPGNPPTITEYDLPQNPNPFTGPRWLTVGPDSKIWFTADVNNAGGVGKLDPASPTTPVSFGGFGISAGQSQGIASGFDNNLWVLDSGGNGRVVRINPATGLSISKDATFTAFSGGRGIAKGPDGKMWAAAFGASAIAKIPPTGDAPVPVEAPTAKNPWDIIAGPDANVYFTAPDGGIGKVNPATIKSQTVFKPSDPPRDLFGIAVGGDGALWSPRAFGPDIARMTTTGQFTFVTGLAPNGATPPRPEYIAAGPDNNTLWFTDKDANKIGRISGIVDGDGDGVTYGLQVTRAGGGSGTVTSQPAGISCGATCSGTYASGTTVTLTAAADAGSTFAGWSGDCSGSAACTVSMTQARAVTATFAALPGQTATPAVPATVSATAVGCAANKLILTDVFPRAGRTQLLGVAPPAAAGKRVTIVSAWNGKPIATPTVQPDLTFSATAPLPPRRLRFTNRARYVAKLGSHRSLVLKFARRMYTTAITTAGRTITFTGTITRPLAKPVQPVVIRASASCSTIGKGVIVATVKPSPRGAFTANITLPASQSVVYLRAETKVRKKARSKKTFASFTLIRGVKVGG